MNMLILTPVKPTNYYIKHKLSLRGFLVDWGPMTANEVIEFGDVVAEWNNSFPAKRTLELHPRLTDMPKFKL